VYDAIYPGFGDARELLLALQQTTPSGTDLFPFLRGPKVGPMWVRMLAVPGSAQISSLEVVPVAVDVQVRRVTEYLGITETAPLHLEEARPIIQAAWHEQVRRGGTEGPVPLAGTDSALDPALWFWGKWGCSACERAADQDAYRRGVRPMSLPRARMTRHSRVANRPVYKPPTHANLASVSAASCSSPTGHDGRNAH
jgi:hypothetical protein